MLRNYLKIALRNLSRQKGYAFINIAGLAVGLACCGFMLVYVQHELSFDAFHSHADRIYRIETITEEDGRVEENARLPMPMISALENLPGIQHIVTLGGGGERLIDLGGEVFYEQGIGSASASAFEVFSFPLKQGDPRTALAEPYTVVLTEPLARKYFQKVDPIGQVLTIEGEAFRVTGVMNPVPFNSHWQFTALTSWSTTRAQFGPMADRLFSSWDNAALTYIMVPEGHSRMDLEAKLTTLAETIRPESTGTQYTIRAEPLKDLYLHSSLDAGLGARGDVRTLYILSTIAVLVLLIACINYMNLASARSAGRAREIGVRKVVGAHRKQLVAQLFCESLLVSIIASVVAVVLLEVLLPVFNQIVGRSLTLDLIQNVPLLLGLCGITLAVGLISGSYPALLLSSLKPIRVLRGQSFSNGSGTLRRGLVVAQFVVSVAFISGTMVVHSQLDYIQNKDPGFTREQIVTLPVRDSESFSNQYAAFKRALLQHSGVLSVTASMGLPGTWIPENAFHPESPATGESIMYRWLGVDRDFLETFEIELATGRDFSAVFGTDSTEAFLLNETAVRTLGWSDPIGREIRLPLNNRSGKVIGVVKDFHHGSFREAIEPTLIYIVPSFFYSTVSVRISPDDLDGTLATLEETWMSHFPGRPFEYQFLDDRLIGQYDAEKQLRQIAGVGSLLTVFIACLGLFGLASHTAERRTKEIGIRKVLGATVSNLVLLLSKDFIRLVLVAFVMAIPVAWYAMNRWLEDFAYRIEIGPGIFLMAGVLALAIALLTVSYQAIKAAMTDPVKSLRYE
jgi:putative ABC transport system permease protein